ncbi:MAG: hypothetical protein ACHREM_00215 [Polyangiales bacterium]
MDKDEFTKTEIGAGLLTMAECVTAAVSLAVSTNKAQMPSEMLALRASIPSRLVAKGVAPQRAKLLAKSIRVDAPWVAGNAN